MSTYADPYTDPYASSRETTEGTVFSVTGGDWDSLVTEIGQAKEERVVVNMGPQHPSTHGVLRLVLELEGETVTEVRCGIGYLHTGIEKNIEFRNWTQGTTFVTRMDYLAPLFNEAAYCLGVEKLLGITNDVPESKRNSRNDDGVQPNFFTYGCSGHWCIRTRCALTNDLLLPRT